MVVTMRIWAVNWIMWSKLVVETAWWWSGVVVKTGGGWCLVMVVFETDSDLW